MTPGRYYKGLGFPDATGLKVRQSLPNSPWAVVIGDDPISSKDYEIFIFEYLIEKYPTTDSTLTDFGFMDCPIDEKKFANAAENGSSSIFLRIRILHPCEFALFFYFEKSQKYPH